MMIIRPALAEDRPAVLEIFMEIIAAGETFALPGTLARDEALAFWFAGENHIFVCKEEGRILGSYYLKPNHSGPGGHVANAGYIVAKMARGKQVGRTMAEHSLDEARRLGFRAMQFNFVVSTNLAAIALWKRLGFAVVGTLPGAFEHPRHGYVDAYVMFTELGRLPARR